MGQLKEKLRRDLITRGFSTETERAYLSAMQAFVVFQKKSPDLLKPEDIQRYHLYLIQEKKFSASTVNVHMAAIRFFYWETLGVNWDPNIIPFTKVTRKVPIILDPQEVADIFNSIKNIKHKALLMTLYSAGLRTNEAINLKAEDIDSKRMLIHIREGKGNKQRYSMLSKTLLQILRRYWVENKGVKKHWLFPGRDCTQHVDRSLLGLVFKKAQKRIHIKKNVNVHSLRHGFATHLLEMGVNLRVIQALLGHSCISSTTIYTRVQKDIFEEIRNPLDEMASKLIGI